MYPIDKSVQTETFMKFYKTASDEDDNAGAAALECLMAIRSLLRGIRYG